MADQKLRDEIMGFEKAFWDAMKNKDTDAAARMTAKQCIVTGATGVGVIDPSMMAQMLAAGTWALNDYTFDDVSVQEIGNDTVIVAYKATEQLTVDGAPLSMTAYDASVWHREDGRWTCSLHTESPAGDPFGRSRDSK